jgi:ADP-ribose pyrophosphatase
MGQAALAMSLDIRLTDSALAAVIGADPQRLAFWRAATGGQVADSPALELALAEDILAAMGQVPAERLLARRGPMLVRADSRLRALSAPAPQGKERQAAAGDVVEAPRRLRHAGFFAVEEIALSFRRFDGAMSPQVTREVFVGCDAITVLPWDPRRDRVLLVEQMRVAPLVRGAANPWLLEAVAGRIDPGETPEQAARREAQEEAGLTLGRLVKAAEYYPTTGAFSEYIYSYIGLCDLPDDVAGVHGVPGEAEDIRGHLLPFAEAMARARAGEFTCAPLLLSLYWLAGAHDGLRSEAGI